ncbi:DUF2024 family protein [Shewanella sp. CG12_big_fil_rev_8_21_14_0_65_47_15]|uniref:DUF2024 family protein n=1 Tax=Shewanella sp. CG12_big_fil_rev_8_21_14_0_65_47_15 TaxID=1975537 RepID=UPI000CC7AB0D|nr:DUF2024 family protein [Shewanella sp. CG12_big_fil_rev_8_21_14_0_65_47_15]PIW61776.1 MAG: DUF2024 domain-containing protein [Shewanella sp. CG12_big_fil_rev_8_21_14_0_65_47_15]
MKVQVFDTHVKTQAGHYLHFDVLVEPKNAAQANFYAQRFLQQQGIDAADIQQQSCNFCHNEIATPEVMAAIDADEHFILKLQGC